MQHGQSWAVVLAAGDGCRLQKLTTAANGVRVPKQFCSFQSTESLLKCSIRRAKLHVPKERIIIIVAAHHRFWWEPELLGIPSENILVQPKNCGTAIGILFPLLSIGCRDPEAKILFLPSDHYVGDEKTLEQAIAASLRAQERRIVLLGMSADSPDTEYGWIVPSSFAEHEEIFFRSVNFFVEKPAIQQAQHLLEHGALWNSFIFSGKLNSFLELYKEFPEPLKLFMSFFALAKKERSFEKLAILYENFPALDFSRHLLEKAAKKLLVLAVPPCDWSDLGTPDRAVRVWEKVAAQKKAGEEVFALPHQAYVFPHSAGHDETSTSSTS